MAEAHSRLSAGVQELTEKQRGMVGAEELAAKERELAATAASSAQVPRPRELRPTCHVRAPRVGGATADGGGAGQERTRAEEAEGQLAEARAALAAAEAGLEALKSEVPCSLPETPAELRGGQRCGVGATEG